MFWNVKSRRSQKMLSNWQRERMRQEIWRRSVAAATGFYISNREDPCIIRSFICNNCSLHLFCLWIRTFFPKILRRCIYLFSQRKKICMHFSWHRSVETISHCLTYDSKFPSQNEIFKFIYFL